MTTIEAIKKYLTTRKTGATSFEIASKIGLNQKTIRNRLMDTGLFCKDTPRKCKIKGETLTTYKAA
jgi:hypothetical protein